MTNLTDKFDELQTQLANQHNALMARLGDTNAKLDELITLQGGTPPTQTVTLQDVVDAIAATNIILADVHLDTQSIDQKALTIRDTLSDVHLDTISMDQKLLRIRDAINPIDENPPVAAKSSIVWTLYRIMDAINPVWPRPTSVPLQPALDLLLALAQIQLPKLTEIDAAIGQPAGDATTTALGLLTSIQYSNTGIYSSTGISTGEGDTVLAYLREQADCGCGSGGNSAIGGTCSDGFKSSGMQLIPFGAIGGNSVVVATWSAPLPAGIQFGTLFGLVNQYAELESSDWTGWKVLVQSDEQQYADSATSTARYPTGIWRDMPSGPGNYSWAVSERGGITVTLCAPGDFNASEQTCEQVTVVGNSTNVITAQYTINGAATVRFVSGGTAVGVYLDLSVGQYAQPGGAYAGVGVPGDITTTIPGPYPRTIGFSMGETSQTVVLEVCTATV